MSRGLDLAPSGSVVETPIQSGPDMPKEIRIIAIALGGLVATRAAVLALDAAVNGWRRHKLYHA